MRFFVLMYPKKASLGKFVEYLIFCGYVPSSEDARLFINQDSKAHVLVLICVKNMIITTKYEINILKDELAIHFEMTNLRELNHFVGLHASRCKDGIIVSQHQYAKKILEKFNIVSD